jgi:hypothetical protein
MTRAVAFLACALFAVSCASGAFRVVDGITVYERPAGEVERYCYGRLRQEQLTGAKRIYGCYVSRERTIVVEQGHPEVLAHELKHAQGWDHTGPCHSTVAHLDGLKLDGTPCVWFRK